jgi:glucuronate isomerase
MDVVNASEAIDIHSHIDSAHPSARSPGDILLYHYIATELRTAGMPAQVLSEDKALDDRALGALPYLRLIRNTTTYWCLRKILKDLHGFEDEPSQANYPELRDKVLEGADRGDRAELILREKAKIGKTFLTFDYAKEVPRHDESLFIGALRIEPIIGKLSSSSVSALSASTGSNIETLEEFEDALARLLKKFARCVAVTASFLPSEIYIKPQKAEAESAFGRLIAGSDLNQESRRTLTSHALQAVVRQVGQKRIPFQMMIGVERPVPGAAPPDFAVAAYEPRMLISFCQLFSEFGDVDFDIFLANRIQSHELAVIAKNYPNVHVSGYWWYNLYPTIIREVLRERIQMLPSNKTNGFFSDAYVADWSYGKACLIRSQVAHVLAEMVDDGFYSMKAAEELASELLWKNPAKLYRLELR